MEGWVNESTWNGAGRERRGKQLALGEQEEQEEEQEGVAALKLKQPAGKAQSQRSPGTHKSETRWVRQ